MRPAKSPRSCAEGQCIAHSASNLQVWLSCRFPGTSRDPMWATQRTKVNRASSRILPPSHGPQKACFASATVPVRANLDAQPRYSEDVRVVLAFHNKAHSFSSPSSDLLMKEVQHRMLDDQTISRQA